MLPLISMRDSANNVYYGKGHSGNYTTANARGCHGTSGSGVFRAGYNRLLGPVVHGLPSGGWSNTKLCDDISGTGTSARLDYAKRDFTKMLEESDDVVNDRSRYP